MIIEAIRAIAGALEHPTIGVVQKLASMTLDLVTDTVPEIVSIENQVDSVDVALQRYADQASSISVRMLEPIEYKEDIPIGPYREARIKLGVHYIVSREDAQVATVQQFYVLRAIDECLTDWFSDDYSHERTRNGVILVDQTEVIQEVVTQEIGDAACLCSIAFTVNVRRAQ